MGNLLTEGNGRGNGAIWGWVAICLITAAIAFGVAIWMQNMQSNIAESGSGFSFSEYRGLVHNRLSAEQHKAIVYFKYCGYFCIALGVFYVILAPLTGIAISKTEIKVYEGGITGKGLSKWFYIGDLRTFDFMLTYSQVSVDLNGGQIVVHGPETHYKVYVQNGSEIQEAIFKQKNERG
ncbi:MAG: hypothetical protein FWC26_04955 [Fibromonadales bacterium]|nr:hypothetical protein [Fibromonadales bacterium]